jgi:hypothetical protein
MNKNPALGLYLKKTATVDRLNRLADSNYTRRGTAKQQFCFRAF